MKLKRLFPLIALAAFGCTTAQLNQAAAVAIPIAEAAVTAAGAFFGVPPSATIAIEAAANALWGAGKQAQASQPVAQGTTIAPIGAAIAKAVTQQAALNPTVSVSPTNAAAILQLAATKVPQVAATLPAK